MQYPLYNYYLNSNLSLDEIIMDYTSRFYCRKHGMDKAEKVHQKILNSSKVGSIDAFSIQNRTIPSCLDFGAAINETMWFFFQSNETQALGVLFAATEWDKRINRVYGFGTPLTVRNMAIAIFKEFSIYGEIN